MPENYRQPPEGTPNLDQIESRLIKLQTAGSRQRSAELPFLIDFTFWNIMQNLDFVTSPAEKGMCRFELGLVTPDRQRIGGIEILPILPGDPFQDSHGLGIERYRTRENVTYQKLTLIGQYESTGHQGPTNDLENRLRDRLRPNAYTVTDLQLLLQIVDTARLIVGTEVYVDLDKLVRRNAVGEFTQDISRELELIEPALLEALIYTLPPMSKDTIRLVKQPTPLQLEEGREYSFLDLIHRLPEPLRSQALLTNHTLDDWYRWIRNQRGEYFKHMRQALRKFQPSADEFPGDRRN